MSFLESLILGILQGLSEFLPISSTGHLTVAGKIMNLISPVHPEYWTAFIATIQLGTLLAVLIYFRLDLINIVRDFLRENIFNKRTFNHQSNNSRMGWLIIIGSIPVGVLGLALKDFIEGQFTKSLVVIAISLIVLGIILFFAERKDKFTREIDDLNWKDALIIGFAQVLALIPGSSRSGTTITAGLFLGIKRDVAAKFSFLLSIPAILGSGILQFVSSLDYLSYDSFMSLAIATLFSFIAGYISIDFLLKYLKKYSTSIFIIYRIIAGLIILTVLYF